MNSTRCSEGPTKTAESALKKLLKVWRTVKSPKRGIEVAEVIVSRTT
jgi:hypothetical protein